MLTDEKEMQCLRGSTMKSRYIKTWRNVDLAFQNRYNNWYDTFITMK